MAVLTITGANFNEEVLNAEETVLVDFWADWCGPCRMLSPIVDEVAEELEGKVKVCKVNIDSEAELATKFGVASIPTLLVIKNGQVVDTSVGAIPKPKVLELIGE